jgi:hypothetical protein
MGNAFRLKQPEEIDCELIFQRREVIQLHQTNEGGTTIPYPAERVRRRAVGKLAYSALLLEGIHQIIKGAMDDQRGNTTVMG